MSLKHKLKLIPARLRWTYKFFLNALDFKETSKYATVKGLQEKAHEEYLVQQRRYPTLERTYEMKGRLEAYNELLDGG